MHCEGGKGQYFFLYTEGKVIGVHHLLCVSIAQGGIQGEPQIMVLKLPWTSVGANIVRNRDTEENDLGLLLASGKHTKDHHGMCK